MDEFGMKFPTPFFSIKVENNQSAFFHKAKEGNFIMLWNEFQGMFFICLWDMNF